ncbi:MAG: serpin family protein [Luteolibacter sp.]
MKRVPLSVIAVLTSAVFPCGAEVMEKNPAAFAVNAFAAKFQQSLPAGKNTLVSPWSLQSSLGMLYAGADAAVAEEMSKALALPPPNTGLDESFRTLRESVLAQAADAPPLVLRSANRVVIQSGSPIGGEWLDTVKINYAADAVQADFQTGGPTAIQQINEWVKQQTEGKIPTIISHLDPATRLVLLNAVYLDMIWDERFTKELTKVQPFHIDRSGAKQIPLMFKQHRMRYSQNPGFQIAALPYAGGRMQFTVLVPDATDGLATLEKSLTPELLSACTSLPMEEVRLSLPRLKIEYSPENLPDIFKAMGMRKAFSPGGFTRIGPGLSIDQIVHKTYLDLDEDGTKAASATAIALTLKNGFPHEIPHKVVRADRPFLFMIQHVPSGTCLFLGRCVDPAPEIAAAPAAKTPKSAPPKK